MKKQKTTDGIAAWKIDSFTERFLEKRADKSFFWKKMYVAYYKLFDSEYYKKGLNFINKNITLFCGEISAKARKRYTVDMVYSLHRFGCMFDEYFLYNFQNLNTQERESFVTDKLRWSYYARLNNRNSIEIFNDKKKCYDLFSKWYGRELVLISSEDDKDAFLEFAKNHKKFIVKPYNSSGGRGVHIKNIEGIDPKECFKELILGGASVVCEGLIMQSEAMSVFHPSSVNTLRIPTIRDKDKVNLFHPLLRTGVGDSVVDNASSGGIFALVDSETGIVCSEARDEKGGKFPVHPNTGIAYQGFQIPDWEQAITLVKELSTVLPDCRYVGWDLAHTENGWVMVEGNPHGQIIMMQLFFDKGFKEELESYL